MKTKIARRLIGAHGINAFELLEHRPSRLCLLCFLPGEVLADELFCLGDQSLLIIKGALLNLATFFALDQIIGVVSVVACGLTVLDLNDATARAIEKISIVRDYDETRRVA